MAEPLAAEGAAQSPHPARKGRPIAVYLLILALVALVPAFAFSGLLLQRTNDAQKSIVQALTQATTQAILQAVDRELDGRIATLRAIASAPSLADTDLAQIYDRAVAVLAGTGSILVLMSEDHRQLLNTRYPFGTVLPPISSTANVDRVLATGETLITGVVWSPTSERWVLPVMVPHRADDGTSVVVALTEDASEMRPVLLSQQLPAGWEIALLDAKDNVVVASTEMAATGEAFFIPRSRLGSTNWATNRVGDAEVTVVSLRSATTGWSVVAWAPRNLIDAPLADAVWSLALGGILLAALVAAGIYFVSSQIGSSVLGLAADARRVGAGQPIASHDYPIAEIAVVSQALEDASHKRLAAEAEVNFLMRELAHRSKNQMTVIAAMAKQTAKTAGNVGDFVESFEKRIFGLARSTDLLLAHGATGIDLRELVVSQIEPFRPQQPDRVTVSGTPLRLNTQSAQIMGMAAHELATNAAKYGAFARDEGTLAIAWDRHGDRVTFSWRETVKRLPRRAERRGFGTVVLENMVGAALGAAVTRTVHRDGIEWTFDIPYAALDPKHAHAEAAAPPASDAENRNVGERDPAAAAQ